MVTFNHLYRGSAIKNSLFFRAQLSCFSGFIANQKRCYITLCYTEIYTFLLKRVISNKWARVGSKIQYQFT